MADNQTGFSTIYDGQGNKFGLVVNIPNAMGSSFTHATPTGTVFNTDQSSAASDDNGQLRFAAVDDNTSSLDEWQE